MNEPSELDIAQLKYEMRVMYRNIGLEQTLCVLNEMLIAARILAEVVMEERFPNAKSY